jgi:C4-dicarboxylate-specific signal transduction histidine kinase
VAETFCTNLREKLDTETEYQTLGPAGEIRWRRAIHRVLLNSQGGVDKVAGIVQDVTERKRAELLIEEQRARAITAPKLSSLGEMSSGIAHEINNPVAIIHGKARSLRIRALEGSLTPAEVVTFSEKIEASAMRIAKIVQSLRIFARDGRSDPFEPASLKKIVFDTLELCLERFKQNGIEVRIPPIDETLQIEVREVQIGQVLLNLLNNSFDAIESLPERWTELRVEELGESVRIRLTDSGAGIPASAREKIFNPSSPPKSWAKGLAWA